MRHRFREDEIVTLADDTPLGTIKKGTRGIVLFLYDTDPLAYEVTFWDPETGDQFGNVMYEDELAVADQSEPVPEGIRIPRQHTSSKTPGPP